MNRREFIGVTAKTALAIGLAGSAIPAPAEEKSGLKKALILSMLPGELSVEDRFKLAVETGFEGMKISPTTSPEEIKVLRSASEKAGLPIHSIIYGGWGAPLSSADPAVIECGLGDIKAGLQCAKEVGADTLLLVPAVVNGDTSYKDAYERSQKHIRSLIPIAEKLKVVIAVENVWNNFLLSPLEFARYVDEFKSPWIRAYFDVGNVVAFGWPEQWIRILGKRIRKIHLKDFKRNGRQWTNLRDGDVNWLEVRKALGEIGYNGYMTAELNGGNADYLKDLSERMDQIIAGE